LNDPIVGIDLGTSNSVIAHADVTGAVKVLADDSGAKLHPSVVSFHPNGGVVVGAAAKQRKVIDPQNTIYSIKRLIGRSYRSSEVQTAKARSPFLIKEGPSSAPIIATRGGEFAVPEISAIVLDHVRNVAAARLDCPVNRAVVTVPASFNDAQRSATATAGAIAGLTVVRVLNEPTAAALAYGHTRHLREIIAVYDFGGGTFDITLLKLEDQVYEVLGTSGDSFLGGDDLDERLVDKMVAKFLVENRIDLRTNEVSMMRLRAVAEQTKIELSRRARAVVRVDEIAYGARGAPLNLHIEISRDEFVAEVSDLIERTFPVCTEALALANLSIDRIADVILVGGTTKIPYVRDKVGRFFGKLPRADVNPEDAVAAGAALQASSLEQILSRRTSSRVVNAPVPTAVADPTVDDETTAAETDVLELADPTSRAPLAPSTGAPPARPRARRPTAGYADAGRRASSEVASPRADDLSRTGQTGVRAGEPAKPDTSYSVTRGGVRDKVAEPERYPGAPQVPPPVAAPAVSRTPLPSASFETRTPPGSQTMPLARLTRPAAVPPPPTQNHATFGVSPAADFDLDLETGTVPAGLPPEPPPPTSRQIAATPHPPATPSRQFAAAPPPTSRQMAVAAPPPTSRQIAATPPPLPRTLPRPGPSVVPGPAVAPVATTAPRRQANSPEPQPPETAQTPISAWVDLPEHTSAQAPAEPHDWGALHSSAGTNPTAWVIDDPSVSSSFPLAPATSPTLVALAPNYPTAIAMRGPGAPTIAGDPSPGPPATARGLHAPQSHALQPLGQLPLAPPQMMPARPAPVLLEVTPRGLGIATVAGFCEEIIRRNSRLPTETKKLFTTSRDQQEMVRIVVCQGESRRLDNNTVIGDLVLQNLPRRPRGETSIEVTFALDASGILHVQARDAQTGVEQRATLDLVGGVAQDDVIASRERLQQLRR